MYSNVKCYKYVNLWDSCVISQLEATTLVDLGMIGVLRGEVSRGNRKWVFLNAISVSTKRVQFLICAKGTIVACSLY